MLKLKDIKKDYDVANQKVQALKGITLNFRDSEFVSILGPSGCGKTTLLNIIGGLDRYTSGDLFINSVSTKEFNDRDWDVYRNHRIGFIFQNYNLIPHQTVLGNVELALTIGGLNKTERMERAKEALDRVGLSDQYYKKPNQLSGGQSQRVAIARALVNNPDILLADEPTGALDTVTSVQIMDLIKEISKETLVIMVTHNPELAEKYSNRIIKLLDGEVQADSRPYSDDDERLDAETKASKEVAVSTQDGEKQTKKERAKMSWWTSFKLSLRNLLTKKRRTIMIAFAGSIGIVGVSLVLAVSSGITNFVNDMQNDMISGYPIEITDTTFDLASLTKGMSPGEIKDIIKVEDGYVNIYSMIEELIKTAGNTTSLMVRNNITQTYIDYVNAMEKDLYATINLDYGIDISNNVYTNFTVNGVSTETSLSAITQIYTSVLGKTQFSSYSSYITSLSETLTQSIDSPEYINSQYDILSGKIATEANEIMIVVNKDTQLTDLLLAQLGYYTQEEFLNTAFKYAKDEEKYKPSLDVERFSYDELLGKKFTWYPNNVIFKQDTNPYDSVYFNYSPYVNSSFSDGLELKIVGIIQAKEDVSYGALSTGFYYTKALSEYILEKNLTSEIVTYLNNSESDGFSSMAYPVTDPISGETVITYIGITYIYDYYYFNEHFENVVGLVGTSSGMSSMLEMLGIDIGLMDSYSLTARHLGGVNIANTIQIYPKDFTKKDAILQYLNVWNSDEDITINEILLKADDRLDITYTDTLSIVFTMINTMINIITYALIVFTAISLVVSTVMIGIITYVSVVERIKEIGVIRSLGGRKRDVSNLFTAETFIIGLVAGLLGIILTYLLSIILNLILGNLIGIATIAALPLYQALIMIGVSVLLTLISGVIPARAAAKKDPVVALRTE